MPSILRPNTLLCKHADPDATTRYMVQTSCSYRYLSALSAIAWLQAAAASSRGLLRTKGDLAVQDCDCCLLQDIYTQPAVSGMSTIHWSHLKTSCSNIVRSSSVLKCLSLVPAICLVYAAMCRKHTRLEGQTSNEALMYQIRIRLTSSSAESVFPRPRNVPSLPSSTPPH